MKLKYKITSIDSVAEEIYVNSYGQNVFEFHKEDFDNNWKNIINKEYELDPCGAADLSKLEMKGMEEHPVLYSETDKVNWYYFARNKIRDDFFTNTERLAEIDADKPIEIYNKNTISTAKEFNTLWNKIYNSFIYGKSWKIDLSHIRMTDTIEGIGDNLLESSSHSSAWSYMQGYAAQIIKYPNIPSNLKMLDGQQYSASTTSYDKDISNLDFSNISIFKDVFYNVNINCKDLNLSNAVSLTGMFNYCKITNFPDLSNLSNLTAFSYFCRGLKNTDDELIDIGDINFESCETGEYLFLGSGIRSIGNVNIPGTVKYLVSNNEDIEEIGDINIKNNNGAIINQCSHLKRVGNITTNGNAGYIIYSCQSITSIGDIVYTSQLNDADIQVDASNADIGNIKSLYGKNINIKCNANSCGVIYNSYKSSKGSISNSDTTNSIKKIKALPYWRNKVAYYLPSSTPFEWWVDYIPNDTVYVKSIVKKDIDISRHIESPSNEYDDIIIIDNLIQVNPNYTPNFILKSYTVTNNVSQSLNSDTYRTVNNLLENNLRKLNLVKVNESQIGLEIGISNLKDGMSLTLKTPNVNTRFVYIDFEAEIDGCPFAGCMRLGIYGTLDFELNEDITTNMNVIYEEDDVLPETDNSEEESE